jgi:hypothetical protein
MVIVCMYTSTPYLCLWQIGTKVLDFVPIKSPWIGFPLFRWNDFYNSISRSYLFYDLKFKFAKVLTTKNCLYSYHNSFLEYEFYEGLDCSHVGWNTGKPFTKL